MARNESARLCIDGSKRCYIMREESIERLRAFAIKHTRMGSFSVHGIVHWDRVANNADLLNTSDVDLLVVKAFAYIHDVERNDDGYDLQHGPSSPDRSGIPSRQPTPGRN